MKKFTKKSIQQKIIISILAIVLAINFIIPTYSHADIGGVLMDPITDLLCTVGDTVINLLQKCMTGDWGAGFSLFDGGFLTSSEDYNWNSEQSPNVSVTEKINPDSEENGFNKSIILGGKTQDYYIPTATYSPEQIFSGNVAGLNVNFFNPGEEKNVELINGKTVDFNSATTLQGTIASWYVALRNLTVVVLLSVLVYVGIRIIISSTASDKAKYKKMLGDWVIALCLVFCLHYIMSFTLTITDSICSAIGGDGTDTIAIEVEGKGTFTTNLLGAARFKTQYDDFGQKIAYLIMYLALVIYTVIFTWFYLKRLLMMAFLTMIAPVVALTYPIDKISDGKAQAFDSWLKEYVFNALIQPFHLIIYTVFVGTAMDLASTNIIYTIAALGFILPAEKILRKFFGFDKAGATLGTLGALGLGSKASKLLGGSKGGKKGISGGGTSGSSDNKPTRFQGNPNINDMLDGGNGSDNSESSNSSNTNTNDDSDQINPFGDQEMADYYNDPNAGLGDEQSIDERMEEIYQAQGDNAFYDPEYLELQRKKEEEAARAAAESTSRQEDDEPEDEPEEKQEKNHKIIKGFKNLGTYYGPKLGRGALNAAKATGEIAFKGAAGTLAGAVAMASGGGLPGGIAAFAAGSNVAGGVINTVGAAGRAIPQMARNVSDVWNGDSSASKKEERKQWEKENYDTYRKEIAKGNGGYLPSSKEMKQKYQELDDYYNAGLRDIKDMLKAQKLELKGVDSKQAALAAALQEKNNISAADLRDDKKAEALEKALAHQVDKSVSQAQRKNIAHQTVNLMKEKEGVANDGKFRTSPKGNPTTKK